MVFYSWNPSLKGWRLFRSVKSMARDPWSSCTVFASEESGAVVTVLEAHLLYVCFSALVFNTTEYCLSLLLPIGKRPRSSPRTSCSNFCTRICTLKNILKLTAHCTSYECGGRVFGANPRLGKIGVDLYLRLELPPGNACLDVRHKGEFDNRAN